MAGGSAHCQIPQLLTSSLSGTPVARSGEKIRGPSQNLKNKVFVWTCLWICDIDDLRDRFDRQVILTVTAEMYDR